MILGRFIKKSGNSRKIVSRAKRKSSEIRGCLGIKLDIVCQFGDLYTLIKVEATLPFSFGTSVAVVPLFCK